MPPPPLLGYNNNVRHRGRVFHIQTEDSGLHNPRIMTHLFADGGRIVKSRRTDYSEHIGRDDTVEVVRGLMKEQHKAMFVALRCGEFDALIGFDAEAPPPSLSSRGARQQAEELTPASSVQRDSQVGASPERSAAGAAGNSAVVEASAALGALPLAAASAADKAQPVATEQAPRAAAASTPALEPTAPVPTAPSRKPSQRPPKPADEKHVEAPRPEGGRPYAAPRPASIFAEAPQAGESLFGETAMDEKSLDSAILSYLSEDDDEE